MLFEGSGGGGDMGLRERHGFTGWSRTPLQTEEGVEGTHPLLVELFLVPKNPNAKTTGAGIPIVFWSFWGGAHTAMLMSPTNLRPLNEYTNNGQGM